MAADPTNRFVYVTDYASNQFIGYTVQSNGILNFLINGPFKTGNEPTAIAIDPRGKYIYVANALDSSVSSYFIDLATGTPSAAVNVTGASINATDTQPVSIADRSRAGSLRVHGQLPRQFDLRIPHRSQCRQPDGGAGHSLPLLGAEADRHHVHPPRQPLDPVGHAVNTRPPRITKKPGPNRPGFSWRS